MKKITFWFSLAGALAVAANAADITWQTPATIASSNDVSTLGTYLGSWSPYIDIYGGGTPITVNGVTFQGNDLSGFTIPSYFQNTSDSFGSPGTTDANYNTLLGAAQYGDLATGGNFTFGGLTIGHDYEIQLWAEDVSQTSVHEWENLYGDEGNTAGLRSGAVNYAHTSGANGQYVIGTFTANNTTQTIGFATFASPSADRHPQVNLFQVRDLTVPEPSTVALLSASGMLMLLGFRRRA